MTTAAWASQAPQVPGYLIDGWLGAGSGGPVWRGHSVAGSSEVAVKVVRSGGDAGREIAVLRAVEHPHVVPLYDAITLDDGTVALVLPLVGGGSLGSVVAARGHLSPGEVVTVIAPLAATLADLHAQGVQHGDLAPGNVLFDPSGRPLLTDLGTVRVTGEPRDEVFGTAGFVDPVVLAGGFAGPASDVYGLGALAWFALTGEPPAAAPFRQPLAELAPAAPAALVRAVEAAVDPDPGRRPAPVALAEAVYDAAPAAPVWLTGRAPADGGLTQRIRALAVADEVPATGGRRHRASPGRAGHVPRRAALVAAVGAVLTVVAVVVGFALGLWPGPQVAPRPGAPAAGTATQPPAAAGTTRPPAAAGTGTDRPAPRQLTAAAARTVVTRLSARRAEAFAGADARALADVVAPGSVAEVTDRAAMQALAARRLTYRGLRLSPTAVSLVSSRPGRAVVDVVTAASAYQVVDGSGRVLRQVGAAVGQPARLTLVRTGAGWRVQSVARP